MIVSISDEAAHELIQAARHYANEAGAPLGSAFLDEFERTVALLAKHPELGVARKNKRRFSLRRFPYYLIYTFNDEGLRVIAVAHDHRKPGYWSERSGS